MIAVRSTTESDFEPWSKMRTALWPSQSTQRHFVEIMETFGKETFQGWVATVDSKYVGFVEASVRPFANGCDSMPVVFLEGVWVDEAYRKLGIGRRLVDVVELWAKSKGISEVGSDAEITNTLSQACHKSWNFEETERVVCYRKKLR